MHVLVGIEGSQESQQALEQTLDRAAEADDTVTIAVFENVGQSIDDAEAVVEAALEGRPIDPEIVRIEADHPASALVERAESGDYEQLVIGGGETSPMGKIDLGSITEYVLLNAQLPVRLER